MPGTGKISQVIGSTFDVEFPEDQLPKIYNALTIDSKQDGTVAIHLTGEVQQHLGGGRVRVVALGSTDGLRRGMDVVDTGGVVPAPCEDDHGGVEELAHGLATLGSQSAPTGRLPRHDCHLGAAGRCPLPVRAALRAPGAHRVGPG